MKKFKKNFSKTVFASFFVFQFIVTTSFMPLVARAEEETNTEASTEVSAEADTRDGDAVSTQTESSDSEKGEGSSDGDTSLGDAITEVVENVVDSVLGASDENTSRQESPEALSGIQTVFVDTTIKVCKVIIDENNQIVSDWAGKYPDATFSTDLTLQGSTNSFDFDTSGNIQYSQDYNFVTVCESMNVPVDPTVGGLISATYSQETSTGGYVWEKNYFEGDAQGETGLYNSQGGEMFSTFNLDDTAYDGSISLNGNPNTGFSATLFLINRFVSEAGECTALPVYARVVLDTLPGWPDSGNKGWATFGTGNMAPQIFVGGTNPAVNEDGGDVYNPGEWFLVYHPVTGYINDPNLTSTDPGVQGLMVQRLNGAVRVVLYGSHTQPSGNGWANREMAHGDVEFSNDTSNVSSDVVITNVVIDAINPPEINPGNPIEGPSNDWISFEPTASHFKFVVTTHNDGYYTLYTHTIPDQENCDDDGEDPIISVNPLSVCVLTNTQSYNFMTGVTANDTEDGNLTGSVTNDGSTSVLFGTAGTYTVTYNVMDSDGNFAFALRTVFIQTNCDGGGEENHPVITVVPPTACILKTATSYNFMNGVSASDMEDGNLTGSVTHNGLSQVDFGVPGSYLVTYSVTDTDGNTDTATRTVFIKIDCGNGGEDNGPVITVTPDTVCIETVTETYNFLAGVSATDTEDGNLTGSVTHNGNEITLGVQGTYTITYKVLDSDGNADFATRTLFIKDDCGGNGGSCDSNANLILNGGFENPTIANASEWAIYPDGTSGLVWDVQWQAGSGDNTPAKAELQTIYTAHNGDQYLELDSDFDGPGGSISNEAASTRISQTISTVPGQEYEISYYYAARPGYGYEDNKVGLYIDGVAWDLSTTTYSNSDDTVWVLKVNHLTAQDTSHTITLADIGTANSYGMFIDDVKVTCVDDDGGDGKPPVISVDPETACILNEATTYDFLSGVTATDGEDGTLIPTYTHNIIFGTNGTYTITYSVTDSDGNTETATRTITIDGDCDNGGGGDNDPSLTFPSQSCILIGATSYDFMAGVTVSDDEGAGQVTVTNNGATVVTFGTAGSYTVTYIATDSDGNVTTSTRTITISEDCDTGGGSDNDPILTVPAGACYVTGTVTTFDFLEGVSAVDFTGTTLTLNLTDNVTGEAEVNFNATGAYQVTYTVSDPFGTDTETRIFTIAEDCDGGNGGGGNGGGGNGGGSRRGASDGEVLGASSCVQFTTYNRVGNTGGEIKALQVFLNEYMNAGLTVDGVYGKTTAQAVHEFQAFHWKEVIDPWTPPLSPNTTGWEYKSTRATINTIIDCPEAPVYLEDSKIMYSVTEVEGQKTFTEEQIAKVTELLITAQSGTVAGESTTFEGK